MTSMFIGLWESIFTLEQLIMDITTLLLILNEERTSQRVMTLNGSRLKAIPGKSLMTKLLNNSLLKVK